MDDATQPRHPAPALPRIAYVLPTHNRPAVLDATLRKLAELPAHDAEIVIADNASDRQVGELLRSGLGGVDRGELALRYGGSIPVHVVRSEVNLGAAGRNLAAEAADRTCEWIVMLDDDSWPQAEHAEAGGPRPGLLDSIAHWHPRSDVAAIAGDIFLTSGQREAGGLPEVVIGCGCAIRRDVFLNLGGYDPAFGYYAEEYDLAARIIASGLRTVTDRRARFTHAKVTAGRDMNRILARLVRNNGWVMQRYAPEMAGPHGRRAELRHVVDRYERIARKEHAVIGWREGYGELLRTLQAQERTPLTARQWDRFIGKAAARRGLLAAWVQKPFATATLVREGKGSQIIRELLDEMGVRVVTADSDAAARESADVRMIGTLSPGPMWDGLEAEATSGAARVIAAWQAEIGHDASTPETNVRFQSWFKTQPAA